MAHDDRDKIDRQRGRAPNPWVIARKITQYLALASFIALFIWSRRGGWPADLVNIPIRLDPLLILSHLLASRTFLAGSALALLTLLLTLVFGRAWCGWLCPLGTVLDLLPLSGWRVKRYSKSKGPSDAWRSAKYSLLIAILAAALFGNLSLLILDPITIMLRTLTVAVWPALDQLVTVAEASLYRAPLLAGPISRFDAWVRPEILPTQPLHYRNALLFAGIFAGIVALNLAAPRFWCRYLCPLGALLGLFSKISLFRRQVGEECKGCQLCTQACPTGTIDPQRDYASDPAECTMCMDCLEACPRSAILFTPGLSVAEKFDDDPDRRQALTSIGLTIAALALFRSDALAKRKDPYALRPPGSREDDFLSKCVRCAECMRACPTGGLQPAISEAGVEGLWTPVLIPRLGYCDYSCNACGAICPVEAIPALELEHKRAQIIGIAYIDRDRCIAWADQRDCIVCEEMCPLPEKAIHLEVEETIQEEGIVSGVQLPYVDRDLCIGCGICEYKCPVNGDAAIRVFVPELSLVAAATPGRTKGYPML